MFFKGFVEAAIDDCPQYITISLLRDKAIENKRAKQDAALALQHLSHLDNTGRWMSWNKRVQDGNKSPTSGDNKFALDPATRLAFDLSSPKSTPKPPKADVE